ncbi:hypothetical protein MMC28_002616 [Mycoblastus sanguinarius]|nr:hypothetical protein [Mycoblastus sanguinarius]
MRLLDTTTIELCEFDDNERPEIYAVLSHRWEKKEEVSLQDLPKPSCRKRKGYQKIIDCCRIARAQHIEYVWIDTCCIDQKSSAEISEAINSMYDWYKDAAVCYAYLADVYLEKFEEFGESDWFKRGWTLQELLAPSSVEFYDHDWELLGPLSSLYDAVSNATGIKKEHLTNPHHASAAQKMSWASKRDTKKKEDMAYCLLGLFQISMPVLYGEGGPKAFIKLQQEISKQSDDESLFAWNDDTMTFTGMFAHSPKAFAGSGDVERLSSMSPGRKPWFVTNKGLAIDLPIRVVEPEEFGGDAAVSRLELAPLSCIRTENTEDERYPFCIRLLKLDAGDVDFVRPGLGEVHFAKGQISSFRSPDRPCTPFKSNSRNPNMESRTVYIRQMSTYKENPYADGAFCRLNHPNSYGNHEFYTFKISPEIRSQGFRLLDWWTKDKRLTFQGSEEWVITLSGSHFAGYMFGRYSSRKLSDRFLLILRADEDRPSLDVATESQDARPRRKQDKLSIYGKPETWPDNGKLQYRGKLTTNSRIWVTLRKVQEVGNMPWPGEKHYNVCIRVSTAGQ